MIPPATILHVDFRSPEARAAAAAEAARAAGAESASSGRDAQPQGTPAPPRRRPLRLLTWNIERGYKLDDVIRQLREADADVLSLQELDIGCDRSGGADTFRAIGAALGLAGAFLCEFEELRSPLRDARSQGGGVHGNAVFSRYDITGWRVLEHSHHPIDWEAPAHPLAAKEPRRGRRATLVADVAAPGGPLRVYCMHLEVFCGILGRVWQFSDILRDVKAAACSGGAAAPEEAAAAVAEAEAAATTAGEAAAAGELGPAGGPAASAAPAARGGGGAEGPMARVAILGDLNTMANGVARLSPHYCCDRLRWATLGSSEASYWQRHVFSCAGTDPGMVNTHFLRLGLPADVCRALVNPGFFDPFDPAADITLDNPAYRLGPLHLMTGKLDWALLKGLTPLAWRMGNLGWEASDHRWLLVEAE